MNKDNSKVPIAVLSCFLIAFIVQGVLKISGVFIFEKALEWDIFTIIDNNFVISVIYYSMIVSTTIYCLSMALTTKFYTKKWYHYFIIISIAILNTIIKLKYVLSFRIHILFDILMYVLIPIIINLTTNKREKPFANDLIGIVLTTTIYILIYLCYLGLCYWSALLNTIIPINPMVISVSNNFLIQLEVYIGLITLMLSFNTIINLFKRSNIMFIPINIASSLAKKKEKREKLLKEVSVLDKEIAELEAKDNAKKN